VQLFLDANVLFAAAISPKGRTQALFVLTEAGYGTLLTSGFAVEEARRNVARKYPEARQRLETLLSHCQVVPRRFHRKGSVGVRVPTGQGRADPCDSSRVSSRSARDR
jgi:predicted nucleic acid-binding protein